MSNHHNARSGRPLVLLDTAPQPIERIFTPEAFARLHGDFEVRDITDDPGALDELVPEAFALVGQSDLPEQRLKRAGKLRAIMNVEGNFYAQPLHPPRTPMSPPTAPRPEAYRQAARRRPSSSDP